MEYDDLKEILKVVDKTKESESETNCDEDSDWSLIPENVFVKILKTLGVKDILNCSECCKRWNFVSNDSLLWKYKFQQDFRVDKSIARKPGELIQSGDITQAVHHSMIRYFVT